MSKVLDLSAVMHIENVYSTPKDKVQSESVSVNLQLHVNTSCAFDATSAAPVSNDRKQDDSIPDSFKDSTKNSHWYVVLF